MLKPLTLAAVLLAAVAPMAHAQEDGPDRGDRYERDARPDDDMPPYRERADRAGEDSSRDMRHGDRWARMSDEDGDRDADRDRDRHERDKREKREKRDRDRDEGPRAERRGPDGHRGPPPPPRAGFEINMGPGQTLRVTCGDESLSDCMEAAKPILDAFADKAGAAASRVPPPPSNLVNGDTPTPPAPPAGGPAAGGTTPPTPPAN
ncbi:hypothetical protein [Aureimonas sp. AU40]|uniref:hypothetical protein n=1 Tax=Aureimonas sp. AU40 TaxID=1637747 RepID=UPI0007808DC7|nr:hypothetical protein [Aureimonas sp. AU40]